ncbi:MAG: PIN domain protein [Methanosaeta sp. PtaB.Bin018]|nr:MAG: PIN domain protein [Methanosaeta sp. PtaB.Bin018]
MRRFLESVDADQLSMTEFALNSIGLITTRLRKQDVFEAFVSDILENSAVRRICLSAFDLRRALSIMNRYHLDFDDAYQYVAAERNGLMLVSFDADFDKTDIKRKVPADLLDSGLI